MGISDIIVQCHLLNSMLYDRLMKVKLVLKKCSYRRPTPAPLLSIVNIPLIWLPLQHCYDYQHKLDVMDMLSTSLPFQLDKSLVDFKGNFFNSSPTVSGVELDQSLTFKCHLQKQQLKCKPGLM